MAEDTVSGGTASVEIEAVITLNEESVAEAKAKLAQELGTDVSNTEGKRAGRGRVTNGGAPTTAAVDAKVKTKLEGQLSKDIQAAIDKDEYQLTIDTLSIRNQIIQALKAPFDIVVNAEIRGIGAQQDAGVAHLASATGSQATGTAAHIPPDELTRALKPQMRDAINTLYRNIQEAFAAGNRTFGKQSSEPGNEIEKSIELMNQFGGKFNDMLQVKGPVNKPVGGSLSPKELGAALGLDPKHPALQTVAANALGLASQGKEGLTTRSFDVFLSRLKKWTDETSQATPAPAAPSPVTRPGPVAVPMADDSAVKQQAMAMREEAEKATKEARVERQKNLRYSPIDASGLVGVPNRDKSIPPDRTERGAGGQDIFGKGFIGPTVPTGEEDEAGRARRDLGNDRANQRRLRGRTGAQHVGGLALNLEPFLRLAEMGRFQDVFEQFTGKGFNESQGFGQLEATDPDSLGELNALRQKPGIKRHIAGQEGKFVHLRPSEAFARTVLSATGADSDNATMEAVRAFLDSSDVADSIKKAVAQGANPRSGASGATKRGQGAPKIGTGASDLGAASKRLFEFIDYIDSQIAQTTAALSDVDAEINGLQGSGRSTKSLDKRAADLIARGRKLEAQRGEAINKQAELAGFGGGGATEVMRAAAAARGSRVGGQSDVQREGIGLSAAERANSAAGILGPTQTGQRQAAMAAAGELPSQQAIVNALIERHLANQSRVDPATGQSISGYRTLKQAAYGPSGRARSPKEGEDTGLFGELVGALPADLGPTAKREAKAYIQSTLASVISDQGFKGDMAEQAIRAKEPMTRPMLGDKTGEGLYTKTPPGILGALRAKIAIEESLPVGHGPEAHGPNTDTHEELEDTTEYGVGKSGRYRASYGPFREGEAHGTAGSPDATGPGGATVIPGLRSRLHELEQRDIRLAAQEDQQRRARQRTLGDVSSLSGDQSRDVARESGLFMEEEVRHAPFERFNAEHGGMEPGIGPGYERIAASFGAAAAGGGGAGGEGDHLREVTGPIHVIIDGQPVRVTMEGSTGGGGGRRPPRGRVTEEGGGDEQKPPRDSTPPVAKNIKFRRPVGVTVTAAERYRERQQAMYERLFADADKRDAERADAPFQIFSRIARQRQGPPISLRRPIGVTKTAAERAQEAEDKRAAEVAEAPFQNFSAQARIAERQAAQAARAAEQQRRADRRNIRTNDPLGLARNRDVSDDELEQLRGQNRRVQRFVPRRGFGASLVDLVTAGVGGRSFEKQLESADRAQRELNEINSTAEKRNVTRTQLQGTLRAARAERDPVTGRLSDRGRALFGQAGLLQRDVMAQGEAIRESTKRFKENAAAATDAATVLKSFSSAAVGSTVSTGIGAVTVGLGMAVAAPLIQGVGQGIQAVLGPMLERATGFGGTTGRTQEALATNLRSNNDLQGVTLAQQGIAARLSNEQLAAISGPLGTRGKTVEGTQSLSQQFDLFNAANQIGQQRSANGFDRALTRSTGGLFDVHIPTYLPVSDFSVGGQASTAETLAGQLKTLSGPTDFKETLPEIGDNLGIGDNFATRQANDQKVNQDLLNKNNTQLGYLNANLKDSKFKLVAATDEDLNKQQGRFAAVGAESLGQTLKDKRIAVQGLTEGVDPREFLQAFNAGPKLSAAQLLAQDQPAIAAQTALEDSQRRFQLGTVNPQTFAIGEAANPLTPAATGINTAGTTPAFQKQVNAELAQTQKLYDSINAEVATGLDQAKDFVSGTLGSDVGVDFAKSLDHVAAIGKEIAGIQIGLQTKQAAYSAAQFSYQIDLAKRSLKDAKELVSGVGSGLGAVEKQMFDLQRQSQALSLGQTQKQINFQTAVAGFQSPGLTSEEREARIEEAKQEASYAQKQLDIQKQLFRLGGRQFTISASRQVRDLTKQLGLLEKGYTLNIEKEVAEKKIIALTKIQAKENKQVETFYNAAVQRTGDVQTEIAKLVSATGKAMADVGTTVLKAFRDNYVNMTKIIAGTPFSSTKGHDAKSTYGGGSAMGNLFMDDYSHAEGWMGSVNGKTSFGKYGVAGEAGGEAVAILRDPKQLVSPMGGGGNQTTVQVNIYNPIVKSDEDRRKLIADVKRAIQTEARLLLPNRA